MRVGLVVAVVAATIVALVIAGTGDSRIPPEALGLIQDEPRIGTADHQARAALDRIRRHWGLRPIPPAAGPPA